MGEGRKVYRVLPLRRLRPRWEDGIRMDLREIGLGGGERWSGFVWLRIGTAGGLL
jgi:hypothetical protein